MVKDNQSKPSEKKLNDILNYYNEHRYDDAEKLIKSILQNFLTFPMIGHLSQLSGTAI